MRQTLKSYTKIYDVGEDATETIELKDTSGTLVDCNYLSVETNAAVADTGYIHVQPSSIYANEVDLSATSGVVTFSGAGGVTFQLGGGPVEVSVADFDRFNAVSITSYDAAAKVILNYGVIKHQNPLRDNERFGGE